MALKLGKCRLCLKLGDFYSIFTMDNSIQLSEMVMECAQVKIYDGDGLPDKICSECVQKLSSAYIFKQQCERSDQELRRNYIPPPGFSITPPPANRQSSDSAFSSSHTDMSQVKGSLSTEKSTPIKRNRKRSHESLDNVSVSSRSQDYRPTTSKRVEELRNSQKRSRTHSPNASLDSDYEDNSYSQFSGETDSDEPLLHNFKCSICSKEFKTPKSLAIHKRVHSRENSLRENALVDIPRASEDAHDDDDKLKCDKCSKTFKLKIMLKRHSETCGKTPQVSPQKELLITLEPIDGIITPKTENKKIVCEICTTRFKAVENLEKHMRVVHAATLKKESKARRSLRDETGKLSIPCIYCPLRFSDYEEYSKHFNDCPRRDDAKGLVCPVCNKLLIKRSSFYLHMRAMHFFPRDSGHSLDAPKDDYVCRICNGYQPTQQALIDHLNKHMASNDNGGEADDGDGGDYDDDVHVDDNDRGSIAEDAISVHSEYSNSTVSSGPHKCDQCNKGFKYKKALQTHKERLCKVEVKTEPPDKPSTSQQNQIYRDTESEASSGEADDNTCDICEKQFSYKRLLLHHKKTKHNMSSGTKRAKINLKDCMVRCLICDVEMKVSGVNEHNQQHISKNIKPRNQYTCAECGQQFKSCSALAAHIKMVHRLKQAPPQVSSNLGGADIADFCEVVVTKAEPLDESDAVQSHNGVTEVPGAGFPCHVCGKVMKTVISLKRHVNWHTNVGNNIEKKIECFVCKESFRFQCHYKLHMRAHYTDPGLDARHLTCALCGRRSKHLRAAMAHNNFHKQVRFGNKDYQCSICKRVFQYRKVYLSHMAIHFKRGEGQDTIVGDIVPNNADTSLLDGTHTCPQCGKVCQTENSLKCHMSWHRSKSALFGSRHECTICGLQFTNKRRLELHTRSHYEDENGPFKCTICGKGYIDEEYFRRHVKGHNFDHQSHKTRIEKLRKDKVKCPICPRFYPDVVHLIRHLRRSHPESKMIKTDPDAPPQKYLPCKLCAKVFLDERRLQHHEEAHLRKPMVYKCKFCLKNSMGLKNHRLHVKQKHLTQKHLEDMKCEHCEETFTRGYDIHHHLKLAHGIEETWIAERKEQTLDGPLKEYQCALCFKVMASRGNYERHLDYHNTLRCNYCFEYFSSSKFLEGHLAFSCAKRNLLGDTETYLKKVKCHVCYKPFHLQIKLDCHLRTQHGIKVSKEAAEEKQDFVCDFCFRLFENEDALTMHKIYHRSVGYYGCIYCSRKFNTISGFKRHKTSHLYQLNVDNPTKCEHCDETFVPFREMIEHMKDVHGDDKEWMTMPKEIIEEKCPICEKTFFNLHRHLSYHEDNKCKKCNEYFYSRADYDQHLCAVETDEEEAENNEIGIRPGDAYEECTFCFKPITRKVTKKKHDQLHKTSGSISCRFCPLKFKTIDAFNIHAFSHRSRKYNKSPIKCRICKEKFFKYGPFMRHMKTVHKSTKKMHYRAIVKLEQCVVCHGMFPNLHNHYKSHLQTQCGQCRKYIASVKLFGKHVCDKPDEDPSKVFTSDANLEQLIKSYVPRDEKDDEKFYGYTDDEEEVEEDNRSQTSANEDLVVQPFVISDVLSLYERKEELLAQYNKSGDKNKNVSISNGGDNNGNDEDDDDDVVALSDDDVPAPCPIITIDDD